MAKTYYSEYVNHCLRFFVRNQEPRKFRSASDKHNWEACEDAFRNLSNSDRDILVQIYSSGDTVADTVYEISKERGIAQDKIWKLVNVVEHKVAKRRGLV